MVNIIKGSSGDSGCPCCPPLSRERKGMTVLAFLHSKSEDIDRPTCVNKVVLSFRELLIICWVVSRWVNSWPNCMATRWWVGREREGGRKKKTSGVLHVKHTHFCLRIFKKMQFGLWGWRGGGTQTRMNVILNWWQTMHESQKIKLVYIQRGKWKGRDKQTQISELKLYWST